MKTLTFFVNKNDCRYQFPIEYASIKNERLETKTASQIKRMIFKIISVVKAEIMLKLPQIIRMIPKTDMIFESDRSFSGWKMMTGLFLWLKTYQPKKTTIKPRPMNKAVAIFCIVKFLS